MSSCGKGGKRKSIGSLESNLNSKGQPYCYTVGRFKRQRRCFNFILALLITVALIMFRGDHLVAESEPSGDNKSELDPRPSSDGGTNLKGEIPEETKSKPLHEETASTVNEEIGSEYIPEKTKTGISVKENENSVDSTHCEALKSHHGFWSNYQCELWRLIENGATIDMTPYQAENIPVNDRFWSPKNNGPGSGKDGRLVYHLHLHKCMGSEICKWFDNASPKVGGKFLRPINEENNCNVPVDWWWNSSQPELHFQNGAYIGDKRGKMRDVYEKIRKKGWIYVASEGSLSDEPIFGKQGPYYYSVILREPISWVISMWQYENRDLNLDTYLVEKLHGVPDFYTRRICGSSCVHLHPLTTKQFLQAKSRLDHFDLVMAQDMVKDVKSTTLIRNKEFPDLNFPPIRGKTNAGHYSYPNLTLFQLQYIQNQTLMDKVLYEYAKVLHQKKLSSYV